jgi:peroxiredoxin
MAGSALLGLITTAPVLAEFPVNRPAPAFTLKRVEGPALSLASLRGKVVLLDFWGPT